MVKELGKETAHNMGLEQSIQGRVNEGFVQVAPDVVCFIFTFLACGPYIFWIGRGVYNIGGKCCGLVPFK